MWGGGGSSALLLHCFQKKLVNFWQDFFHFTLVTGGFRQVSDPLQCQIGPKSK